jgi:hypothetical protein
MRVDVRVNNKTMVYLDTGIVYQGFNQRSDMFPDAILIPSTIVNSFMAASSLWGGVLLSSMLGIEVDI